MPEPIPNCFFCGGDLNSHTWNRKGHPWRRGPYVTVGDLVFADETTKLLYEPEVRQQERLRAQRSANPTSEDPK